MHVRRYMCIIKLNAVGIGPKCSVWKFVVKVAKFGEEVGKGVHIEGCVTV